MTRAAQPFTLVRASRSGASGAPDAHTMTQLHHHPPRRRPPWQLLYGDASLSALLAAQVLTSFVAIPLAAIRPTWHLLLDLSHLLFAAVCVVALTDRRAFRVALLAGLLVLAGGPPVWNRVAAMLGLAPDAPHEVIAFVAFAFNALVTFLVARRSFGPGPVTAHRIQGAILIYLNVAVLFAISYDLLEIHAPGAIRPTSGQFIAASPGAQAAQSSYFSLVTITTTGYGDIAPIHPLARSLANLEAVFGQLFPATFVARLIALHLAHREGIDPSK